MAARATAACGLSSVLTALKRTLIFCELLFSGASEHYLCTPSLVKVLMQAEDLKKISVLLTSEIKGISLPLGVEGLALMLQRLFANRAHG